MEKRDHQEHFWLKKWTFSKKVAKFLLAGKRKHVLICRLQKKQVTRYGKRRGAGIFCDK